MASNIQVELTNQKDPKEAGNAISTERRNSGSGLEAKFVERVHELNTVVRRRVSI